MIAVKVRHRQGDFVIDAAFEPVAGLTALFGPSGSGKTSLVQIIAGLTRPDDAVITFGDVTWTDTSRGLFVPPHKRRIGYVFQEGRLFPHLTARQNLLYGRFFAPRGEQTIREDEVVQLLGIERLLAQRPATLSGGEKQRVAIGRALLSNPRLILMDEPLSALDRARRQEILPYIERVRDEIRIPVIYVSHALDEVARLADCVVLLDEGRVKATGRPGEVFPELTSGDDGPAAQSIIEAYVVGHDTRFGLSMAKIDDEVLTLQPVNLPEGTPVRIRVPATDVMISLERHSDLSALNQLPGTIVALEADGHHVLATLDCHGQRLVARITSLSAERLGLRAGLRVHAMFKAVAVDGGSVYRAPGSGT
ncbi:MAG: molybdenum ABC transporter ATP-binding protein [Rhizobium sp.]|nr:molybdenum ABC transporter ATP-binding protein [Rhizobium sp.]